jgi:hypothetical protein
VAEGIEYQGSSQSSKLTYNTNNMIEPLNPHWCTRTTGIEMKMYVPSITASAGMVPAQKGATQDGTCSFKEWVNSVLYVPLYKNLLLQKEPYSKPEIVSMYEARLLLSLSSRKQ